MGDAMSSLFPDVALLPGGAKITAVCESLQNSSLSNQSIFNNTDYDALNCNTSAAFGFVQLLVLFAFYAYILFVASNFISDGSEMLTLIPSMKHVVGSVVLPVLGAVPDGAIVLFSGIGPLAGVQEAIKVGVGALAGSTIMLLTIPWFMSILAGKVPVIDGEAIYPKKKRERLASQKQNWCCGQGVEAEIIVKMNGIVMVVTLAAYLLIQIPAITMGAHGILKNETASIIKIEAEDIKYWALAAFIVAMALFVAYLIYSVKNTGAGANDDVSALIVLQICHTWFN